MKQFAIKVNGVFNGIYEWGKGYKSATIADKFEHFWAEVFPRLGASYWKYAEKTRFGECGFLSCSGGSIYMHPMEFNSVLVASAGLVISQMGKDGEMYYNHFESVVRELNKICEECAKYCGGTFELYISKEFVIETPTLYELREYSEIDKDNYAQEMGVLKEN